MKQRLLAAGAAGLALACATVASAQSVDYGSLEQLFNEPVTTSATGSPQRSTEVPVDMTIISAADIKRSGATDLPTIISRVAGVDVLQWTSAGADVAIRGYNQPFSPRLLVLVNGRQVYLDHYGFTAWSTIPVQLDEIRQIEVVRGPNSALFGFNAVGGVINIITVNPKYDDANAVTVRGGTQNYGAGSIVATHKFGDKLAVRGSLGYERRDEWGPGPKSNPLDAISPHPFRKTAALDAVAQIAPKTELRLEGSYAQVDQTDFPPDNATVDSRYETWSVKGALTSETDFGVLQAQAYMNHLRLHFVAFGEPWAFENPITVVSVQDLLKIGANHTVRVGVEYRDNRLNDTAPTPGGKLSYKVWAPSAMWNWNVSPKVSVTGAVRLDHVQLHRSGAFPAVFPASTANNALWDRSFNAVSGNAGVVFKATDEDTVRLAWARGVQAPTLLDFGGLQMIAAFGPASLAIAGNPDLDASTVDNVELAYDRAIRPLKAKVSAKIFYQATSGINAGGGKLVFPTAPGEIPVSQSGPVGDSTLKGFELAASSDQQIGFRWAVDYTYTDVKDEPLAPGLLTYAQTTPKYRGNVAVGWANDKLAADAYLHYVGKFRLPAGLNSPVMTEIDSYATLGGRVGYTVAKGLTLAISGENLLNDKQSQTTGLMAERRVIFSVNKTW